jgi:hypothetical protein
MPEPEFDDIVDLAPEICRTTGTAGSHMSGSSSTSGAGTTGSSMPSGGGVH